MEKRITGLEIQITEMRKLNAEVKKLKTLKSYTDAEKIAKFNKLFEMAEDFLRQAINGEEDEDSKQWAWEAVMKLLGNNVFDVYNKLPSQR